MEVFSYALEDFLPFGKEAFLLLLSNYNAEFWPLNLVLLGVCALAVGVTVWRAQYAAWILIVPWGWLGLMYYRVWYWQLNWAADFFVAACVFQGLLIAFSIREDCDVREWNLTFPIAVIIATPFLNYLFLERWWIESVGFTPFSTSLFFIGWLAAVKPFRWWLALIPGALALIELATYSLV